MYASVNKCPSYLFQGSLADLEDLHLGVLLDILDNIYSADIM